MPFDIGSIATTAGADIINAGIGLALESHNDERQINQQKALNQLQLDFNQKNNAINEASQLDLWQKTGYEGQVEQMKAAGLNPGLLYSKGGSGGSTAAATTNSSAAGTAPRGSGMEIANMIASNNLAMQQAQIANLNANTEKTKEEANKIGNVMQSQIDLNNANTGNTEADTNLKDSQTALNELKKVQSKQMFSYQLQTAANELQMAKNNLYKSNVSVDWWQKNKESISNMLAAQAAEGVINNALNESKITLNDEQRTQIKQEITNSIKMVTIAGFNANSQRIQANASTSQANTSAMNAAINQENAETNKGQLNLDKTIKQAQININQALSKQNISESNHRIWQNWFNVGFKALNTGLLMGAF